MMPEKKKTVAVAQVATRAPERLSTKMIAGTLTKADQAADRSTRTTEESATGNEMKTLESIFRSIGVWMSSSV